MKEGGGGGGGCFRTEDPKGSRRRSWEITGSRILLLLIPSGHRNLYSMKEKNERRSEILSRGREVGRRGGGGRFP